jgi:DNA-directed RNA polymerase subunit beta'
VITVKDGQQVESGEVLARIPQETSKTRDITGGLPRVAELFEARSPKTRACLPRSQDSVSFGKDTKGKQRLVITISKASLMSTLIPKDKHVMAHDGQVVNTGEVIVDWSSRSARHPASARCRGTGALHHRRSAGRVPPAGVKINDKHIEVIVRRCCAACRS